MKLTKAVLKTISDVVLADVVAEALMELQRRGVVSVFTPGKQMPSGPVPVGYLVVGPGRQEGLN
jgi:hypothetical protein